MRSHRYGVGRQARRAERIVKLRTLGQRLATVPRPGPKPVPATTVERKRGDAGVKDRQAIKKRDNGLCQLCEKAGTTRIGHVVDHRVPLADGGTDEPDNKWCLCRLCHDAKTAREAKARVGR